MPHPCSRITRTIFLLVVSCVTACQQSDESSDSVAVRKPLPDNGEVMSKVYDPAYRVPDGFFADARAATPRSYSVYHVKDSSGSYERCADDFDTASDWESADNAIHAVQGVYVGAVENERYYEFIRELSYEDDVGNIDELTSPGYARIFKCQYVNRDGVDRHLRNGYAGRLMFRPMSSSDVSTFVEYLWQFTFFWPAKAKVLGTHTTEDEHAFRHTLLLGLRHYQGIDHCDRIEVVDWTYSVDRQDGSMEKGYQVLHQFEAHVIDGQPKRCVD